MSDSEINAAAELKKGESCVNRNSLNNNIHVESSQQFTQDEEYQEKEIEGITLHSQAIDQSGKINESSRAPCNSLLNIPQDSLIINGSQQELQNTINHKNTNQDTLNQNLIHSQTQPEIQNELRNVKYITEELHRILSQQELKLLSQCLQKIVPQQSRTIIALDLEKFSQNKIIFSKYYKNEKKSKEKESRLSKKSKAFLAKQLDKKLHLTILRVQQSDHLNFEQLGRILCVMRILSVISFDMHCKLQSHSIQLNQSMPGRSIKRCSSTDFKHQFMEMCFHEEMWKACSILDEKVERVQSRVVYCILRILLDPLKVPIKDTIELLKVYLLKYNEDSKNVIIEDPRFQDTLNQLVNFHRNLEANSLAFQKIKRLKPNQENELQIEESKKFLFRPQISRFSQIFEKRSTSRFLQMYSTFYDHQRDQEQKQAESISSVDCLNDQREDKINFQNQHHHQYSFHQTNYYQQQQQQQSKSSNYEHSNKKGDNNYDFKSEVQSSDKNMDCFINSPGKSSVVVVVVDQAEQTKEEAFLELVPQNRYEILYKKHEVVQLKKQQKQLEQALVELQECTFHPDVTQNNRINQLSVLKKYKGDSDIFSRLYYNQQANVNREIYQNYSRQARVDEELAECTFKPDIDKSQRGRSGVKVTATEGIRYSCVNSNNSSLQQLNARLEARDLVQGFEKSVNRMKLGNWKAEELKRKLEHHRVPVVERRNSDFKIMVAEKQDSQKFINSSYRKVNRETTNNVGVFYFSQKQYHSSYDSREQLL